MSALKFVVTVEDESKRIDHFLALNQRARTRSQLEKLFYENNITINGKAKPKNYKLKTGDVVEIIIDESAVQAKSVAVKPQDLPLITVYEDEHLLVVNKPKGMVVHPSSASEEGTLVNALLHHCKGQLSNIGGELRPGIVHRIDKDTSGLLIVAKTNEAHKILAEQAESHQMHRVYEGVLIGNLKSDIGVVEASIGRHPTHRTKNTVLENGRHAVTHYRVLARYSGYTHTEFTLETGRMHQIRVHMAHLGHPVAGDKLYANAKPIKSLNGQCLHARTLGFIHPICGEKMEFTTELPQYFTNFIDSLAQK